VMIFQVEEKLVMIAEPQCSMGSKVRSLLFQRHYGIRVTSFMRRRSNQGLYSKSIVSSMMRYMASQFFDSTLSSGESGCKLNHSVIRGYWWEYVHYS